MLKGNWTDCFWGGGKIFLRCSKRGQSFYKVLAGVGQVCKAGNSYKWISPLIKHRTS